MNLFGMSLSRKLFAMFLLLSTIPLISIGMFSYTLSSRIITEKEINENLLILSQVNNQVSSFVGDKHVVALSFQVDKDIQALIANPAIAGAQRKKIDFAIRARLFDFHNLRGADSIILAIGGGPSYSNRSDYEGFLTRIQREEWFRTALQKHARRFWGEPLTLGGEIVVPLVQVLTTFESLEPRGILVINLRETYLQALYASFMSTAAMSLFITSESSIVISHPDSSVLGRRIQDIYGTKPLQTDAEASSLVRRGGGNDDLVLHKKDPVIGLDFFSVTSLSVLLRNVAFIRRMTLVAVVIMVVIGLLTSLLLSRSFLSPMNRLIVAVRRVETSTLDHVAIPRLKGEVGLIADSFAAMVEKLRVSVSNEIRMQKEKREADLRVLEFQINPHFLYNTLSSVVWLSRENRNEDVIKVAKSLSNLFRISISKGREIIPVAEELEHVKSYIEIEKIRHGEEFGVEWDIEPGITANLTVKLVLQPIVENAIYHGIKQSPSGRGTIRITGTATGGNILFQVMDDGDTLSERETGRLNEVLDETGAAPPDFGIGIRNVNDRIRLRFGRPYGLHFSKDGALTVVSILIPRLTVAESS